MKRFISLVAVCLILAVPSFANDSLFNRVFDKGTVLNVATSIPANQVRPNDTLTIRAFPEWQGAHEFRFSVNMDGVQSVLRDYSSNNTIDYVVPSMFSHIEMICEARSVLDGVWSGKNIAIDFAAPLVLSKTRLYQTEPLTISHPKIKSGVLYEVYFNDGVGFQQTVGTFPSTNGELTIPVPNYKGSELLSVSISGIRTLTRAKISIYPNPTNYPPTAMLTTDLTTGSIPLTVRLDASLSYDNDGTIQKYRFNFDHGVVVESATPSITHTFTTAGTYLISLTVLDDDGAWSEATQTVIYALEQNTPPVAVFSESPESGSAPLLVQFDGTRSYDSDGTIVSYTWELDGSTYSGATLNHTFTSPGTFDVKLTVKDNKNVSASTTKTVLVFSAGEAPIANFFASTYFGDNPLTVTFNAMNSYDPDGGTLQKFYWDFKDGSVEEATFEVINHTFTTPGTYAVELKVVDDEGAVSSVFSDTITVVTPNIPPVAVIAATPETGHMPLAVHFDGSGSYDSDGTIKSYTWTLPSGSVTGSTTDYTFTTAGDYTIKLTVKDDRNVTTTVEKLIHVLPANIAPVAKFNADVTSGDLPLVVNVDASGSSDSDGQIASYSWDFGDGETGTGAQTSHTYTKPGEYNLTLTVTDDAGDSSSYIMMIVAGSGEFISNGTIALQGVSETSFNPIETDIGFNIADATFSLTAPVSIDINDIPVDLSTISRSETAITLSDIELADGQNTISIETTDSEGASISQEFTVWAGAKTIDIHLHTENGGTPSETEVTAHLASAQAISAKQTTSSGEVSFQNIPANVDVLIEASSSTHDFGVGTLFAADSEKDLTVHPAKPVSPIDNNDFSQGASGWDVSEATTELIDGESEGQQNLMMAFTEGASRVTRTYQVGTDTRGIATRFKLILDNSMTFTVVARNITTGKISTMSGNRDTLGMVGDATVSTWQNVSLDTNAGDIVQVEYILASNSTPKNQTGAVIEGIHKEFVKIAVRLLSFNQNTSYLSDIVDPKKINEIFGFSAKTTNKNAFGGNNRLYGNLNIESLDPVGHPEIGLRAVKLLVNQKIGDNTSTISVDLVDFGSAERQKKTPLKIRKGLLFEIPPNALNTIDEKYPVELEVVAWRENTNEYSSTIFSSNVPVLKRFSKSGDPEAKTGSTEPTIPSYRYGKYKTSNSNDPFAVNSGSDDWALPYIADTIDFLLDKFSGITLEVNDVCKMNGGRLLRQVSPTTQYHEGHFDCQNADMVFDEYSSQKGETAVDKYIRRQGVAKKLMNVVNSVNGNARISKLLASHNRPKNGEGGVENGDGLWDGIRTQCLTDGRAAREVIRHWPGHGGHFDVKVDKPQTEQPKPHFGTNCTRTNGRWSCSVIWQGKKKESQFNYYWDMGDYDEYGIAASNNFYGDMSTDTVENFEYKRSNPGNNPKIFVTVINKETGMCTRKQASYAFGCKTYPSDPDTIPGHYHVNSDGSVGGFVAETASVDPTVYVGTGTNICEKAQLKDHVRIYNNSGLIRIHGNAIVSGSVQIFENSRPYKDTFIRGVVDISGNAEIRDRAVIKGALTLIRDNVIVDNSATVEGYWELSGHAQVRGQSKLSTIVSIYPSYRPSVLADYAEIYDYAEVTSVPNDPGDWGRMFIVGNAKIYGQAHVSADSFFYPISKNARVYDNAVLVNTAVTDDGKIHGSAHATRGVVEGTADVTWNMADGGRCNGDPTHDNDPAYGCHAGSKTRKSVNGKNTIEEQQGPRPNAGILFQRRKFVVPPNRMKQGVANE